MVVIALLAILAAATFLKPLNWFRSARINNGIDQIVMIDQLTRQQSVRTDKRLDLAFDLTNGTVMRIDPKNPEKRSHRIKLPGPLKMTRLLTASQQPVSFGKATIPYANGGCCPTYALRLQGPDQLTQWLVIAGLTGQAVTLKNEKDVHELLQQLVP